MNKNGIADIVVADLKEKAYLFYGGQSINNTPVQTFSLKGGNYVCQAGDVNGDGYADMIHAQLSPRPWKELITEANLYYGGATVDAVADVRFNKNFQIVSINSAGDVNNDGFDDLLLADYKSTPSKYRKSIYVYHGGSNMDVQPDLQLQGDGRNFFGEYLIGAGDLNGDGYADVLASESSGYASRFHIYYGGSSMSNRPNKTIMDFKSLSHFGRPVAGISDMNGDGQVDIIAGARGDIDW